MAVIQRKAVGYNIDDLHEDAFPPGLGGSYAYAAGATSGGTVEITQPLGAVNLHDNDGGLATPFVHFQSFGSGDVLRAFSDGSAIGASLAVADTYPIVDDTTILGSQSHYFGGIHSRVGTFGQVAFTVAAGAPDLFLERDGANALGLRNGVNAQTLSIYGTYAGGGADYERIQIRYNGANNEVLSSKGGAAALRNLDVGVDSGSKMRFTPASVILSLAQDLYLGTGADSLLHIPGANQLQFFVTGGGNIVAEFSRGGGADDMGLILWSTRTGSMKRVVRDNVTTVLSAP